MAVNPNGTKASLVEELPTTMQGVWRVASCMEAEGEPTRSLHNGTITKHKGMTQY